MRDLLTAGAAISSVNLAEVYAKIKAAGRDIEAVESRLLALGLVVHSFRNEDARATGELNPVTRQTGLSLGDRACLALGARLNTPVITADRAWNAIGVGVDVRVIR